MPTIMIDSDKLQRLKELALRGHYYCDDSWYSCPKATEGCADESQGEECNCGADKHNAEVEALFKELTRTEDKS